MSIVPSLLRLAEYKILSTIAFSGRVLDLGGERRSNYLQIFKGQFKTTTLNISEMDKPDILHDLEKPLPVRDGSYEHVLLINVLEHVFAYHELLRESFRVLKPGGSAVIVVPFLFPVHPSPEDFHRFTASALERELLDAGYKDVTIQALGGGVFASCYLLIDRLLPRPVRFLSFYSGRYITYILDTLLEKTARLFNKKYQKKDYPLGYCAVACK